MRQKIKPALRITDWLQALPPRQRAWLPYITLVTAVFAVYANVYRGGFMLEEWSLIVYNDSLRHWSGLFDILTKDTLGPYYRPVQELLYFFIYQTFGLSEAAFHGVNVLLHAVDACLMYCLGCRLGFYKRASFAAALLWAVHPIWNEQVARVAATADLLEAFFCLLGLFVLLPDFKPRRSGAEQISGAFAPRKIWIASLFFILALGTKESAIVFPALATFTLFLLSKERLRPATYFRTWPLWLLVTGYLIRWFMSQNNNFAANLFKPGFYVENYEHNFINRVLTSLATLPVYLGRIIAPPDLHLGGDTAIFTTVWDWQVIAGAAMIIAALAQIVWGKGKRGLPLTWGLLWFAAAFAPYTGILQPISSRFSEHWIYIPVIGLFLGVSQTAAVWMDTLHSKKVPGIAAGLVVLAALGLGIKTHHQNEIFNDVGSMFENVIKYNPTVFSHYELGVYYFGQKEYEKAAEQWRAAEQWHGEEANDNYKAYLNKGAILFMHNSLAYIYLDVLSDKASVSLQDVVQALPSSRHVPEAIEELKAAEDVDPHVCCASEFLAGIYYAQGDKDHGDYYKALTEKNMPTNEIQNPGESLR